MSEANFVKFVRASAKTKYHKYKKEECYICGCDKDLELHHNIPLSEVIAEYLKENSIKKPTNDESLRATILDARSNQIFGESNLITLCRKHHRALHSLFGRTYNLKTSEKVVRYVQRQKEKMING